MTSAITIMIPAVKPPKPEIRSMALMKAFI
jgi:hypothetical protein